jgi:hypothetical protein
MKRRTFLRNSSIGLSAALVAGAVPRALAPGDDGKRRLYGVPDSVRPRTPLEHDLARFSLARTDLPPDTWRDVVALGFLAQDVFDRPEVARAFSRDPAGYLRAVGLEDVALDPESVEVKVALALGDPEVRAAIEADSPGQFLAALERRGLLHSPEPSQLASRLAAHLEAAQASAEPGLSPESCTVVAVCLAAVWIWVGVIQDVVAAVTAAALVSIYAYALIYTETGGPKIEGQPLLGHPSFRMAGALGGSAFRDRALEEFVGRNVDRIATAVESLQVYRDRRPLEPGALRDLVRQQLARQLSGHALPVEVARP